MRFATPTRVGPATRAAQEEGAAFYFSLSFNLFYSNLDISFESKIQIYFMSLNGYTTTKKNNIQNNVSASHATIKDPFLGFILLRKKIYINVYNKIILHF